MARIFSVLAVVSVLLLAVAVGFGLRIGEYNETYADLVATQQQLAELSREPNSPKFDSLQQQADQVYAELKAPRERARIHMLVGVLAGLVAVLVNSVSVTYFIGTSRWCKEVVDTYELDPAMAESSTRFKRRCFPWALAGMLIVVVIVAFGAASDPGTLRQTTMNWVLPHFTVALGGTALMGLSFYMQATYILQNSQVVDQILARVREVRLARGLDVEG